MFNDIYHNLFAIVLTNEYLIDDMAVYARRGITPIRLAIILLRLQIRLARLAIVLFNLLPEKWIFAGGNAKSTNPDDEIPF